MDARENFNEKLIFAKGFKWGSINHTSNVRLMLIQGKKKKKKTGRAGLATGGLLPSSVSWVTAIFHCSDHFTPPINIDKKRYKVFQCHGQTFVRIAYPL